MRGSKLFDMQTEAQGDEEEQQQAAEEPTLREHKELSEPTALPTALPPEEYEALIQRYAARHDWTRARGSPRCRVTSRNYQRIADYQVSTADPDATLM